MTLRKISIGMAYLEAEEAVLALIEEKGQTLTTRQISTLLGFHPNDGIPWAYRTAERMVDQQKLTRYNYQPGVKYGLREDT